MNCAVLVNKINNKETQKDRKRKEENSTQDQTIYLFISNQRKDVQMRTIEVVAIQTVIAVVQN
jgi:hypothetical protein